MAETNANVTYASSTDRIIAAIIDGAVGNIIPFVGLIYLLIKDSLPFLDGQSVGKKLMKIRVVKEDTLEPITGDYGASAIRQVAMLIPILNLIEIIKVFGGEPRKRFGDEWAKTIVIKEEA